MKLGYCQGEFDCWVKTPGVCRTHDAEQDIVQAIHDAANLVLLDEVTFGGHSYTLKRAQDRLICLLSPFFEKRSSLTHHDARYGTAASLFALGWLPHADVEQTKTWRDLADANAINMLAPTVGAAVLHDAERASWESTIRAMLAAQAHPGEGIHARAPLREALMAAARPAPLKAPATQTRTAAVLVGSSKIKGTSVSEALARATLARLERHGVTPQLHFATDFLHDGAKAHDAAVAVAGADLFILATPLYVDSFPALATRALEKVAAARVDRRPPASFVALVNCGFPEPEHTRTALAMGRHFSNAAGYVWAGGLALGGGGAINPGTPLDEQHGPAEHVKRALDAAVPALARGGCLPDEALALMVQAAIPDALYRVMGDLGWRHRAHQNGLAQAALRARPLDEA